VSAWARVFSLFHPCAVIFVTSCFTNAEGRLSRAAAWVWLCTVSLKQSSCGESAAAGLLARVDSARLADAVGRPSVLPRLDVARAARAARDSRGRDSGRAALSRGQRRAG
jgi:hypothetical protein